MSVKIMKNSVSLKDETTQTFLPIGMFAAGGDKSLKEFKEFADTTVNEANTQVQRAHDNVGQLTESITSALETGTDTTLSLPGVAADAKATGDKIGELKSDLAYLSPLEILSGYISEINEYEQVNDKAWQIDRTTVSGAGYLYKKYNIQGVKRVIATGHSWGKPYPLICFYDVNGNRLVKGTQNNAGNTQYTKVSIDVPDGAVECYLNGVYNQTTKLYTLKDEKLEDRIKGLKDGSFSYINAYGEVGNKYDADTLPDNSVYRLYTGGSGNELTMKHLPYTVSNGVMAILITLGNPEVKAYKTQIFIDENGSQYFRYSTNSGYNAWIEQEVAGSVISKSGIIRAYGEVGNNYDADTLPNNTIYRLYTYNNTTELTMKHLPYTVSKGVMATLITLGSKDNSEGYRNQILITDTGLIYYRWSSNSGYSSWVSSESSIVGNKSLTISSNDDVVAKFIEAYEDPSITDVYIQGGDYDVIQLYKNHYGENYFDDYIDYNQGNIMDRGIVMKNGIHYHFSQNAIFHADYSSGTNTRVKAYFSMFATQYGKKGYIVDGLKITECKNLRYAIHDDWGSYDNPSVGEFRNCHIVSDVRCIGSGIHNGCILKLKDCVFIQNNGYYPVHIHTPNPVGHKGKVIVTGCYFNNQIGLGAGGSNTEESSALVTNCSFSKLNLSGGYELIQFNNHIHDGLIDGKVWG